MGETDLIDKSEIKPNKISTSELWAKLFKSASVCQ